MRVLVFGFLTFVAISVSSVSEAQISARLMRYPDVSQTHITFVYGDDMWIVDKDGGIASRLTSPSGAEIFPRFSPDGKRIAYSANYDGNTDVYVIEALGGIPKRLTYHGMYDRVIDWDPKGDRILFASSRESGRQRFNQFYTVSTNGGIPEKLPVPYGENASYSPDGSQLAFTDLSRVQRTWKRYRGGMAPDIYLFDLKGYDTKKITNDDANDEMPMWSENSIYFLSDRGPAKRANIWKYDISSGTTSQLTKFTDFDIEFPAIGPTDIVFQAGDKLYLLNLSNDQYKEVKIQLVSDQKALMPVHKDVSGMLQSVTLSPAGNRIVAQARGELFSVPATEGYTVNLSQTSGAAERSPSWSPDGRYVACWSDATGEYQLTLYDMTEIRDPRTVSKFTTGFRYKIYWSPDSKKIAYIDQAMQVQVMDVGTGQVTTIDHTKFTDDGDLEGYSIDWSPDSRWVVYFRETSQAAKSLKAYNVQTKEKYPLTSGYYNDRNPVFSKDGR